MTILNPCIQVRNVPPSAPSSKLRDVFASTGDVKGIWVRFQETHGIVILAFYDIRHAMRAKRQISSQVLRGLEDIRLEAAFITAENLERVSGRTHMSCQTGPLIHARCSHCMHHLVGLGNNLDHRQVLLRRRDRRDFIGIVRGQTFPAIITSKRSLLFR